MKILSILILPLLALLSGFGAHKLYKRGYGGWIYFFPIGLYIGGYYKAFGFGFPLHSDFLAKATTLLLYISVAFAFRRYFLDMRRKYR